MGVYKLSTAGGIATPRTNYSSFLAGNPKFVPPSYESIQTVSGNGSATTLTLSSIPQTYTHLQLRIMASDARAISFDTMQMYYNSDATGGNYSRHALRGDGSSASAQAVIQQASDYHETGQIAGTSVTSGIMGVAVVDILDYTNTNKYKVIRSLSGVDANGSGSIRLLSGLWNSTSAITSITFNNNGSSAFSSNTQIALYGIKGV
jgi:hypothetical protein